MLCLPRRCSSGELPERVHRSPSRLMHEIRAALPRSLSRHVEEHAS